MEKDSQKLCRSFSHKVYYCNSELSSGRIRYESGPYVNYLKQHEYQNKNRDMMEA